jgi:CDP-glycerol glycerophosphotransferase
MTLDMLFRRLRTTCKRLVLRGLMHVIPVSQTYLVYGYPDHEENSLVLVARLATSTERRIVLLCADPERTKSHLTRVQMSLGLGVSRSNVAIRARRGVADLWPFLRARCVIYTHGIFDSPKPAGVRVHINIWHGTGPKRSRNQNVRQRIGATHLAACSGNWGRQTAEDLGMPPSAEILVGNPRQDLLFCSSALNWRAALGIGETPFVVWMPTYRISRATIAGVLTDGTPYQSSIDVIRTISDELVRQLNELGIQLVVKPHPLDAEEWADLGVPVITTDQILLAGVTMHEFLGAAVGLVSDYSSAWVDFLITGRPIGLLCHDLDSYRSTRGFNLPLMSDVANDFLIRSVEDVDRFADALSQDVSGARDWTAPVREALDYREGRERSVELVRQIKDLVSDA